MNWTWWLKCHLQCINATDIHISKVEYVIWGDKTATLRLRSGSQFSPVTRSNIQIWQMWPFVTSCEQLLQMWPGVTRSNICSARNFRWNLHSWFIVLSWPVAGPGDGPGGVQKAKRAKNDCYLLYLPTVTIATYLCLLVRKPSPSCSWLTRK